MASKGGNPFLMDDYPAEPDPAQQASNPFLQDFVDTSGSTGGGENPFLNFSAEQPAYEPPAGDSTNPFAFFGAEPAEEKPFPEAEEAAAPVEAFGAATTNFFGIDESYAPEPTIQPDLFGTEDSPKSEKIEPEAPSMFGEPLEAEKPPAPVVTAVNKNKPTPARPPPPPRPHPPLPPKNTKDLILSVTGALDATSNHLLDRLQATRTPSPTLMHSPSPTPEHSFADLLDVDSNVPELIPDDSRQMATSKNQDIMDLFDVPNSQTSSMFSGSNIGLDTNTQLVSSTDTTFATGIVDTTANIQENPFDSVVDDHPQISTDEQDHGVPEPTENDLIGGASEKRVSVDAEVAAFSGKSQKTTNEAPPEKLFFVNAFFAFPVAETIGVTMPPVSSGFDFAETGPSDEPISVESSFEPPAPAETILFSAADTTPLTTTATTRGSVELPTGGSPFVSSAPTGIFGNDSLFSNADTSNPIIPTESTNVFASDLLADFARPAENVDGLVSTSPVPGAEFPIGETYRNEDLDNFAATTRAIESTGDAFDAFASKFDKAAEPEAPNDPFFDAFGSGQVAMDTSSDGKFSSTFWPNGEPKIIFYHLLF